MKAKLVAFNGRYSHSCLALFYVRNELEIHCPEIDLSISQYTINDSYYELILKLSDQEPDYIFFSALIWNSDLVTRLIKDLAQVLPSTHFVVGGPQAEVLQKSCQGLSCSFVIGQIEAVGPDFYDDLRSSSLKERYGGNFFRKPGNKPLSSAYRDSDFKEHLQNRSIYYESSRGCPFSCTYCLSGTETGVFHKPLEQVFDELQKILSYSPKSVRFVDRTFNDVESRALAIWRFLLEQVGGTMFHFEIAPDRFSEEMLQFLAGVPSGFFQFEIGIQSTNEKSLSSIKRVVDTSKAKKIISRLAAHNNIHIHADLILGLPYETKESYLKSFSDVFNMEPHYIQMGILKLLPDTEISYKRNEYGYLASAVPPYTILQSKWMGRSIIYELYWFGECVEKFLNNRYFVSLWRYLRRIKEDALQFFQHIFIFCSNNNFFNFSATHEYMGEILLQSLEGRKDYLLIIELLKYDWFRCGHRFTPAFLKGYNSEDMTAVKKELFASLPNKMANIYDQHTRNNFLKRALFVPFTRESLNELGYEVKEKTRGILCFTSAREEKLHAFSYAALL